MALGDLTIILKNFLLTSSVTQLQDMEIWETIGLWHYPIPGYYLLAQFGLGFLVAMCNLVNSSVLLCITDQEQLTADESVVEGDKLDGLNRQSLTIYSLLVNCDEMMNMRSIVKFTYFLQDYEIFANVGT